MILDVMMGAAAFPALAAPGHYAISAEQVAATVSRMGMQVSPEQVTLLTDVVATKVSPVLTVRSIERWSDQRMMARLECENQEECLPFFVSLRVDQSGASTSLAGMAQGSPLFTSVAGHSPKDFVLRSGSPATLLLDSERVHITLAVVCLESGAPGQTIRVTNKDSKLVYRAQVIDGHLLKGRL
jgi:hypothetical protein